MPVRFGPFEIDLSAAELRKHGVRVQLQEQPFRVLAELLNHPGEVVSREDLMARLWAGGTHVDFDRGLNAAVTRLRQALSDSAEEPKYIETVPKRGYRFVGRLETPLLSTSEPAAPVTRNSRAWIWIAASLAAATLLAALRFSLGNITDTSEPRLPAPLTSYSGYECRGSLSPDGRQLAFDWTRVPGDTRVYIKLVGDGEPVRFTSGNTIELNPVWSPDGRKIAYYSVDGPGRIAVYVKPALGGIERKLVEFIAAWPIIVEATTYSGFLTWSPDGTDLVITAPGEQAGSTGLLLVSLPSGGTRWLLPRPNQSYTGEMQPSFSPDGRTLAFIRRVSHLTGDVYIAPFSLESRTAGEPRQLTHFERMIGGITWLPDGKSLLFSAGYNPVVQLFRLSIEPGSKPVPLHWAGNAALQPSLSRSGALVFTRRTMDRNIWRQEIPSSPGPLPPPEKLIASTEMDAGAQYSPDGTQIAFKSTRSGAWQIWTCASDGTRCVQLTDFRGADVTGPSWSPDGRSILFASVQAGSYDVYVVNASGGVAKRLTDHPTDDSIAVFSRDARYVYFSSVRSGKDEIWRIPAEGGPAVQITRNGGGRAVESQDGVWLFYSRSDPSRPQFVNIWKKSLQADTEDIQLVNTIYPGGFAVSGDRLWYKAPGTAGAELRYTQLSTGRNVLLGRIPAPDSRNDGGFSVSPEGRYILYTQNDNPGSDLMFVENLR